jgi:hypothetical protein
MCDGGRLQTRESDAKPGVHEPRWREPKYGCCLTMDTRESRQDPNQSLLTRISTMTALRNSCGKSRATVPPPWNASARKRRNTPRRPPGARGHSASHGTWCARPSPRCGRPADSASCSRQKHIVADSISHSARDSSAMGRPATGRYGRGNPNAEDSYRSSTSCICSPTSTQPRTRRVVRSDNDATATTSGCAGRGAASARDS